MRTRPDGSSGRRGPTCGAQEWVWSPVPPIHLTLHHTLIDSRQIYFEWCLCRRMKLEKELVAQLWRICWDDIQMSNLDKVLRSGSRLTLSLVGARFVSVIVSPVVLTTPSLTDPLCVSRRARTLAL